ncbi:RluA family pseudouridine synthase [Paenibacillus sp. GSMTC-2017]|uniref:RluA family pseudouridine synthase n=1 Tax=Paenibacillus sp. GSMTC-2017 TaxID=2794350 RepID=UPI0018D5DA12|nr:RluA family pseudouridine synthase [Paenibacillus sp. GSMTC-2017]MBH5317325.1 RluA family pseudouridine synthase [Paenibacillus sp. GSMTC-2017]
MNKDNLEDLVARYYRPLEVVVSQEDDGKVVRNILDRRLGVSRKLLSQVKLTEHGLTVNEERVYTTAKVSAGDVIRVRMEREESEDILPQPIPIEIVFEDDDLLIVHKPAGMIVHPTHGHYTGTLANGVVYHWRERGERVRFRPIHRLDEETSGLVAIAKTSYVHQQISEQLQAGTVTKLYRAYVYGVPEPITGTIDEPIDRDIERPHIRVVTPTGYPSVTHYEIIKSFSGSNVGTGAASVKLKLETGRTHQIRVHMRFIGCPLIGDKMYGSEELVRADWEEIVGRQALHAETLGFVHPITKEQMVWHAPLPAEMQRLEQLLAQNKEK